MKFSVVNLGCKVNRVESDNFLASLQEQGASLAELSDAQVIVINTCTVTGEAEKKTRKTLRRCLRANPHAKVVVTGCAAAINPDELRELSDRVVIEPLKNQVVERALSFLDIEPSAHFLVNRQGHEGTLRVGEKFPTRVGLKIQDGCNNSCSFCIVHVARGRATSTPRSKVCDEVLNYARHGVREIVLTGINLGSYRGESRDYRLAQLLEELLELTADFQVRFRISSLEPRDASDQLVELLAQAEGRVCRHLHLPLQAGSSRVLREMRRPYDRAYYEELVYSLYERIPTLSLSTDIIVGFPGESDEDFESTLEMARLARYSKIHAFPYSKREGTPAARRDDQVFDQVKSARMQVLLELGEQMRQADFDARLNTTELVLVESEGRGMTESYHELKLDSSYERGMLVPVCLTPQLRV